VKILVVEDEAIIAEDIREILVEMDHTVRCVNNPEAAERFACSGWPEMILMDMNLQTRGDGLIAAHKIVERWDIPVIFVTSSPMSEIFVDSRSLSCGYCSKPVDPEKLERAIEKMIARKRLSVGFAASESAGKNLLRSRQKRGFDFKIRTPF